ncbi:MAG: lectin-like protein [Methylococcaceae bacterium]
MATFQYNGHTYLLSSAGTWLEAQANAQSLGGNLVTINDQAEQDWLFTTFGSNPTLWIGYTDQETEGVFKWINGESSTYTDWGNMQPDNHGAGEDYAALGGNPNGVSTEKWNDLPNSLQGPAPVGIIEIAGSNNSPTGTVTINDTTPEQNQTLTVTNTLADADGLGTITYQWQANGVNVGTGASYTLTQAEVGKTIIAIAGYTDSKGTAESVSSTATTAVLNVNDLPTGGITITGIVQRNEVLTVSNTLVDADGLGTITYQWQADGVNIGSGASYTLTQAEVGKTIVVIAGYTDNQGTTETKASAATTAVLNTNNLPTGNVTITGIVKQGEVLTASNSLADVNGLGTVSYKWNADGTVIGSGSSYTLTQDEVGKKITVTAGYTDDQNSAETVNSTATAAVANVNDLPTGTVTITGTAKQGEVLTASNSLADADGLGSISYQWAAGGTVIGSGNSYTLTADEVGKTITVTAGYTDNQNTAETVSSKATSAVAEPTNHAPTGAVTITGSTVKGQTLTASNTLADTDGLGTISYQWQANDVTIGTGNSYTLTANEVGKTVTVIAGYTDGLGKAESVTSADTSAITAPTTPGFSVSPTTLQSTGEDGATVSYSIQLNTAPLAKQNVVITFTSSDTSEGIINTPTLTFTSTNYATAQTLTVQGVDDYLDDGDIPYLVTAKVTTLDVFYKTLAFTALNLTNADDGLDTALDLYGDENGSKSDVLTGGNGADKLHGLNRADNLSGGLGNDSLWGGYGDDNLFGEDGDDKLLGEQENDYMEGGAGNDTLDGGDGADTMVGGAGNDTYYLGYDAVDVITDDGLATDIDTVIMPYQLTSYTLPTGIEKGTIAAGTVASNLTGNTGDNELTGNSGKNILSGAVGRDSLFGGAGNDILLGGTGNDTLSGGNGKDIFKFNSALTANTDKISDFVVADDTIQLENSIFTKLSKTGVLTAASFVKGTAAVDSNDYLIYNSSTGALTYDADGSGAGAGVQIALLGVSLALTHADFVVI